MGRSSFPGEEWKDVEIGQRKLVDQGEDVLERGVGFTRESDKDVNSDGGVRNPARNFQDPLLENRVGVRAAHTLEDVVIPALQWDVEVGALSGRLLKMGAVGFWCFGAPNSIAA